MARQRAPKAGKSAKKSFVPFKPASNQNSKESSVKRWNSRADVQLGDEDAFHQQQDEIRLEDRTEAGKRNLKNAEYSDGFESSEEEVFRLGGDHGSDSDDSGEEFHTGEESLDDEAQTGETGSEAESFNTPFSKKRKGGPDDTDEMTSSWGAKKYAYYGGEDVGSSDDEEEDRQLLEEEAIRLQRSQREAAAGMELLQEFTDEDGGSDQDSIEEDIKAADLSSFDKHALFEHLKATSPESLALIRELEIIGEVVEDSWKIIEVRKSHDPQDPLLGPMHLHYETLTTYASLLPFYFFLRNSEPYVTNSALLAKHPIMENLFKLKEGLSQMSELGFGPDDGRIDPFEDSQASAQSSSSYLEENADGNELWRSEGLEQNELEDLVKDNETAHIKIEKPRKKESKRPAKPKKQSTLNITPLDILPEPEFVPSKMNSRKKAWKDSESAFKNDDHIDAVSLSTIDAEAKAKTKKSLQFHTSKLTKSSARRAESRMSRMGGDEDVPYHQRQKPAVKPAQGEALGGKWSAKDELDRVAVVGDDRITPDDATSYVDLVRKRKAESKESAKTAYDTQVIESRITDPGAVAGPRGLPRQILLNKSLIKSKSPKSKAARNPRVKKRQRFEAATKKAASMKATYKGPVEHYSGEQSGVGRSVRSVKL